ncbi:hypothetical protein M408DRAFT_331147 [Serendipita vermifera MAFF 305830]|uniref:C2H2-type domain-containing protein n=1 Tax=Serendipita vermifera MAFF 305830 TaxID=933852 RepID=A0A0C2WGW5_SERVB|nr:hypothetical protein M408DRAFT_331147 [Serendipita vermifera MAFF 305830]
MSSWGGHEQYASGRASPPRDERRRDSRHGEPNYGSYEDNVRDWEEQERLRQWDEYERARSDWERRVNEYKSADRDRYGSYNSLKRPRSPSPYERDARPRRDSYDPYGRGGRNRYDDGRRSPRRRYSPDSRYRREPTLPHPMDQDRLVPYRSFLEWYKETDPERYYLDEAATKENPSDRKVGLKARYDDFRADYNAKQVQVLFEKHHKASWFLEKYDPTEKYSDLRARVRKQGWHGALNHFLEDLEGGKFDYVSEAVKSTTTSATSEKAASQNGETQPMATTEGSEEKKEEKPLKQEDDEDKGDEDAEWGNVNGDTDEVIIPHKGHQVMIKTIPPDIGRLTLEPVVDKLTGVVSLAVGEPVARRNYYRSAWIEFGTEKEARDAMDKLAGQEVDNFRLQVTMIRSPLIARIKRTSVLVSTEKRLAEDLKTMKKLVDLLEKEADMLANYKPLAERVAQDKEGDIKMESPVKENGSSQEGHVHRGSAALQARLDKLLPITGDETDEYRLQRLTVSVDLYLNYLRSAFYCCYYCAVIADRADELQRKCVKHIRTPFNEKEMQDVTKSQKRSDREEHWFLLHDEKVETLVDRDGVDPTRFGGKDYEKELQKHLRDQYKEEDEGKYRCNACAKMFRNAGYVCKHIANKHPELVGEQFTYDTQIYNNFALDPHRIQMPPANPPPPGTGRHARDASRRDTQNGNRRGTMESAEPIRKRTPPPDAKIDPRAGQRMTYQDLDEVAGGEDIALMY